MLSSIIKKELLENIVSYRLPLFFLICAVLIVSSLYVHELDYSKRLSDYSEQVRLADDALASSRMWDIHFGTIPLKGFRPPSPLSIFASGFESSLPRFYEFQPEGYKQGETPVGDQSVLSVFGKFDFVFIIQMVVSLIVLLFASDVISGEKELGTLRSILSNSVPRHNLLIGKLVGGYIAVWLPFVISFLLGLVLLAVTSFPLYDSRIAARIAIIFLAGSLFILEVLHVRDHDICQRCTGTHRARGDPACLDFHAARRPEAQRYGCVRRASDQVGDGRLDAEIFHRKGH